MQYNESGLKTFVADTVLPARRRVKRTATGVALCGAAEAHIGVTERPAAQGKDVPVRLRTAAGTCVVEAAGAIAIGDVISGGADGKVVSGSGGAAFGTANTSAATDEYLEAIPS